MNYELAKQLRIAGFDQEYFGGHYLNKAGYVSPQISHSVIPGETGVSYAPTLEEILEACGEDNVFQLNFPIRGKWNARKGEIHGEGETPIEAIAKLWLALNDKKKI